MIIWQRLVELVEALGSAALISITSVEGSAPREAGTHMIVTANGVYGTIGGGALEWQAVQQAQAQLAEKLQKLSTTHLLGPELGQCCGGRVTLLTEVFGRHDLAALQGLAARESRGQFTIAARNGDALFVENFGEYRRRLYLFGAGHVGRALILALAPLPFSVVWIDSRADAYPGAVPGHVHVLHQSDPLAALAAIEPNGFALVMTHSHALDFALVDALLRRDDMAYVGLIGSATKRQRFVKRLGEAGITPAQVKKLTCPIGLPDIRSKHPAAIAIATAGQLLCVDERLRGCA